MILPEARSHRPLPGPVQFLWIGLLSLGLVAQAPAQQETGQAEAAPPDTTAASAESAPGSTTAPPGAAVTSPVLPPAAGLGGGKVVTTPPAPAPMPTATAQPAPADPRLAQLLVELRQGFGPELPYFGLSLYGGGGTRAASWRNIPIDPYYQLGPGDVILANLWGTLNLNLQLPVNEEGYVVVPGGDRVYVNGLTFGQLEEVLLRELRQRHAEALTPDKFETGQVRLEVKLGEVHGVQVLVTGQVAQPGGLTFDSPSVLLLDALGQAGGITSRGSLRQVSVRRGGEERQLDLYDLLVSGQVDVSRFLLRQGDVVFVPYRERTVSIKGAVKQPAIYELARSENLASLIEMAGGLTPKAFLKKVQITRADEKQGTVLLDLDLERTPARTITLKNGDQVEVLEVTEQRRREIVKIEGGGVINPGTYQLTAETADLQKLLAKARLYEDALRDRCLLIRMGADYSREKLVLNLDQALEQGFRLQPEDQLIVNSRFQMAGGDKQLTLSGHAKSPGVYTLSAGLTLYDVLFNYGGFEDPDFKAQTYLERGDIVRVDKTTGEKLVQPFNLGAVLRREDDFPLVSEDEVVVYPGDRFKDTQLVTIDGEVRVPGAYQLKQGMNLADLLILAGGLAESADSLDAEVSRRVPGEVPPFQSQILSLAQPTSFTLRNRDIVQIRRIAFSGNPRTVTIGGEVKVPGRYVLSQVNERLSQLVRRAGGFSPQAFLEGVQLYRTYGGSEQRVAIDLAKAVKGDPKHDLILMDGDRVTIPLANLVVEVKGEVRFPQMVQYNPGAKAGHYMDSVGGHTPQADHWAVHFVRANGLVRQAHRRLWFDPAVPPGSTLIVPAKPAKTSRALWRNPYVVGLVVGSAAAGLGVQYGLH